MKKKRLEGDGKKGLKEGRKEGWEEGREELKKEILDIISENDSIENTLSKIKDLLLNGK